MSGSRPGVHVAVYCQEPVLHAAAQTCFEGYVRQLVEAGRMAEARRLWDSVVEVQHLPLPDPQPIRPIPGLPPMRRSVCCAENCARCDNLRGGFQFPWVGRWTNRGALVWPGTHPADAWQRYASTPGTLDLLQIHMLANDVTAEDLCPGNWHAALQLTSSAIGCAPLAEVALQWRQWQLGSRFWVDPAPDASQQPSGTIQGARQFARRSLNGWLAMSRTRPDECLPPACRWCGTPSRRICAACYKPFCEACVGSPFRPFCCDDDTGDASNHFEVPALRPGQRDSDLIRMLVLQGRSPTAGASPSDGADDDPMGSQ